MRRGIYLLLSLISILFVSACGQINGQGPAQFAGIVDTIQFEDTLACQEKEKKILYQNLDKKNAQSVKWIGFQGGWNKDNYFRIKKATIGTLQEYTAIANEIKGDISIPPGGVLEITTSYKPRKVTNPRKGEVHETYLDIFLETPALGFIQYKMTGHAPQAAPGCGERGPAKTFKVNEIVIIMKDKDLPTGTGVDQKSIPGNGALFTFYVDNTGKAIIDGAEAPPNIPTFNIPAPGFTNGVEITLTSDEFEGTFDGTDLIFNRIDFAATGIPVPNVPMTTQSITITQAEAPDVMKKDPIDPTRWIPDDLTLQGESYDPAKRTMTVVFATPFPDNNLLGILNDGAIGMKMKLVEQ